jgi:hypothetical protein
VPRLGRQSAQKRRREAERAEAAAEKRARRLERARQHRADRQVLAAPEPGDPPPPRAA